LPQVSKNIGPDKDLDLIFEARLLYCYGYYYGRAPRLVENG